MVSKSLSRGDKKTCHEKENSSRVHEGKVVAKGGGAPKEGGKRLVCTTTLAGEYYKGG